jgi:hypothetical protein
VRVLRGIAGALIFLARQEVPEDFVLRLPVPTLSHLAIARHGLIFLVDVLPRLEDARESAPPDVLNKNLLFVRCGESRLYREELRDLNRGEVARDAVTLTPRADRVRLGDGVELRG